MKVKYIIIFFILLIVIRPLYAQISSYERSAAFTLLQHMSDDTSIKKDSPHQQQGNEENPDDDNLNDDTNDTTDSDEDFEDIPDDFYDYQEENF